MVFPMYTRPHVRFSIPTACLVLREPLRSMAMVHVVFMVIECVCVIFVRNGSFIILDAPLMWFLGSNLKAIPLLTLFFFY